jgi:hypothetical protein
MKSSEMEAITLREAIRYAVERAARDNATMYIWRSETRDEVRIAVRDSASGPPWSEWPATHRHILTVRPDGSVVPSENRTLEGPSHA